MHGPQGCAGVGEALGHGPGGRLAFARGDGAAVGQVISLCIRKQA